MAGRGCSKGHQAPPCARLPPDGRVRVSTPLRLGDGAVRLALFHLAWIASGVMSKRNSTSNRQHQCRLFGRTCPAAAQTVAGARDRPDPVVESGSVYTIEALGGTSFTPGQAMYGLIGARVLVNGTHDPYIEAVTTHARRVRNGAKSRSYKVGYADRRDFRFGGPSPPSIPVVTRRVAFLWKVTNTKATSKGRIFPSSRVGGPRQIFTEPNDPHFSLENSWASARRYSSLQVI